MQPNHEGFLVQLNLLPLLFSTCSAIKSLAPPSVCGIVPLSLCPSACLSLCLPFALVLALSERWHWETAVTWDASRSWQGLGKLRQKGGRGPLSENGGTDLPHSPSLFLFLSLPGSVSANILYPPPPTEAKKNTSVLRKRSPRCKKKPKKTWWMD